MLPSIKMHGNSYSIALIHNVITDIDIMLTQVPAGTRESKRTTIPFIYNLGHDLAGMDVIDYPGVDDRDETIPELAELLLSLAQIVVFVVDYKLVCLP